MNRKLLSIVYLLLIVVLAVATWVEHLKGTDFAHVTIYGSWWFSLLWAALTLLGLLWIFKKRLKRLHLWLLHGSFVLILVGALLTHLTSWRGLIHLREGEMVNTYEKIDERQETDGVQHVLPFSVRLKQFSTEYHSGTSTARDYSTTFVVIDGSNQKTMHVAMNKIEVYRNIRFYQHSYDTDGQGSYLALSYDPWGIGVTYMGYALLFISVLWMLIDKKGTFRRLLRSSILQKAVVVLSLLVFQKAEAVSTVPEATAQKFGKLCMQYSGRICPVQTFAIDFTKKIHGSSSYHDLSAEQVLLSWIFYPGEWENEPILKVKNKELRKYIGAESTYSSVGNFFSKSEGYLLGRLIMEYRGGKQDALHKAAIDMDEKLQLIMYLRSGENLNLFPERIKGSVQWISPVTEVGTNEIPKMDLLMVRNYFAIMYGCVAQKDWQKVDNLIDKLGAYQYKQGASTIPSSFRLKAELLYNKVPFVTILFVLNLLCGILMAFIWGRCLLNNKMLSRPYCWRGILFLSLILLTFCLALRWIVSGEIPMGNGYETMLFMAWLVQLVAVFFFRRLNVMLIFGFLLSGIFLLVSHISQMDPQITYRMPVLGSPLLTIHVSIIMMAYALLSFTFFSGVVAVLMNALPSRSWHVEHANQLTLLSKIFLYPALAALALGIFIGAVWANVSWGQYWSWDPKETWALITFLVYAVPVHAESFPVFRKPLHYHIYMILAFLTLLMTYFGVNYLLSGMHSYA